MWKNPDHRVCGNPTLGAQKALAKASSLLQDSKMCVEQMITKTPKERYGTIKDILVEAETGLYDAVILGKRASYTLQWMFERPADEIAKAAFRDNALEAPVWVCPAPKKGSKNVLVALDGSAGSLRAVDHVGYILANQEQHDITLMQVRNSGGPDAERIFAEAMRILSEQYRIAPKRIETVQSWGINVAATLMAAAEKGNFAAIATGLQGEDGKVKKRISRPGNTTIKLLERAEKVSLWCCP